MTWRKGANNSAKSANFPQLFPLYPIVLFLEIMQNSDMDNRQNFPTVDAHIKVLVVDDHPNTANMLARAISRLGSHVEVVSATSGLEALQHVEDGAADILITDMMMPGMTGMELIETLNSQPAIAPAVIFLLTAHDSAGVREIAQRLNVKGVIAKPVSPEWLCQLITQTTLELQQSLLYPGAEPKQEDLNIHQLLREVAKKFQPQSDGEHPMLVVGQVEPDAMVKGNAVQLRQALRSLIWNAIKNTPSGGSVILSSAIAAHMVKIFVRDTGYGEHGHIDNESIDEDLATVKGIAEGHGGAVTVESEVGKGTCFTLSLPLYQIQESAQASNERKLQ